MSEQMTERRSWDEFRESGLLWWINRTLHLFGWAIVVEVSDDGQTVQHVYPARCKFRGFTGDVEERGFRRLTTYMKDHGGSLLNDVPEEQTPPSQ